MLRPQPAWHVLPSGARLQLWPQKAAFDPELRLLLVADAHLGKAVSFRRLGVPVPSGTTAEALARLDALLHATQAREIVFLGDLLHSARAQASHSLAQVAAWRARWPRLALTLVRGNHDRHAGDPPTELGVQVVDGPLQRGPWALRHEPDMSDMPDTPDTPDPPDTPDTPDTPATPGGYVLAGHVHPGVVLAGRGGDRLRLPCFCFGPRLGLLPAFGPFTGLHVLPRRPRQCRYAVAEHTVQPL